MGVGIQPGAQYAFILPAALTIAGWFVVARQAERREFRKEVRDQIRELREGIDEVKGRATEYWLEGERSKLPALAIALKAELKRLSWLVAGLSQAGLDFDHAQLVVDIRTLATGGDFESKKRKRSDLGSGLVDQSQKMTVAASAMAEKKTAGHRS